MRSTVLKNYFLSEVERVPVPFDQYWVSVKGRGFGLKILPILSADEEDLVGMLAAMSLPPPNPPPETKYADIVYLELQQDFPQLDIRRAITEYSVRPFNGERFVRFRDVKRIKSLVMLVGHDGTFVIFTDAAHSFPPGRDKMSTSFEMK